MKFRLWYTELGGYGTIIGGVKLMLPCRVDTSNQPTQSCLPPGRALGDVFWGLYRMQSPSSIRAVRVAVVWIFMVVCVGSNTRVLVN